MMSHFMKRILPIKPASTLRLALCVLALFWANEISIFPPANAAGDNFTPPINLPTSPPINLCDYSGPTFDDVNALLHKHVKPGDHVDRLLAKTTHILPKTRCFSNLAFGWS